MTVPAAAPELGAPLAGCVFLVTADRRSAELGGALERRGATVRHAPALTIASNFGDDELIETTRALIADPPDTVVATTGVGFRGWIEAADAAGLVEPLLEILRGARLIARGPKARGAIQQAGLLADWVAESETAAELSEFLLAEGVAGHRIAVQHHGSGSDGLDEAFTEAGADVVSLVVYRWGPPVDPAAVDASTVAAANGELDGVLFTSAPGVSAWLAAAERTGTLDAIRELCSVESLLAAAVGPVTAKPLLIEGIRPLVPDRGRLGSLVRALVAHYATRAEDALATSGGLLQVRRGAAVLDGRALPLSPSGLIVLRLLAEARGAVVTREQLLDALPGTSTDPHTAEVAVARLRDALGRPGLIRTVVKRGYRLDLD